MSVDCKLLASPPFDDQRAMIVLNSDWNSRMSAGFRRGSNLEFDDTDLAFCDRRGRSGCGSMTAERVKVLGCGVQAESIV